MSKYELYDDGKPVGGVVDGVTLMYAVSALYQASAKAHKDTTRMIEQGAESFYIDACAQAAANYDAGHRWLLEILFTPEDVADVAERELERHEAGHPDGDDDCSICHREHDRHFLELARS